MIRVLTKLSLFISAFGVAILATLIGWTVFIRWFTGNTPHWAEELPQFTLIWVAMLSAIWCSKNGSHLSAGMLGLWLKNKHWLHRMHRLVDVIIVIAMLVLTKAGWDLSWLTMKQTSTAMQWPVGLLYISVPVSCASIALIHFYSLVTQWRFSHE